MVAFVLIQVVPGDPVLASLGPQAVVTPEVVEASREKLGLDKPLPVQYGVYVGNLVRGDLGVSSSSQLPVREELATYIPATLELAIPALGLALVISLVAGTAAALRSGRPTDQAIRVVALAGVSTPSFWLAIIAVYALSFKFGLLPSGGRLGPDFDPPPKVTGLYTIDSALAGEWAKLLDALKHLVLPVLTLVAYAVGFLTRFIRSAVLEVVGQDYVRLARAKGLPTRTVVGRHILRPALVSVITVGGLAFASLLAGAVLVERVFSWPGVGQYAYRAASGLDLAAVIGVTLFVGTTYVVLNLVVDLLYGVIDPRIRIE